MGRNRIVVAVLLALAACTGGGSGATGPDFSGPNNSDDPSVDAGTPPTDPNAPDAGTPTDPGTTPPTDPGTTPPTDPGTTPPTDPGTTTPPTDPGTTPPTDPGTTTPPTDPGTTTPPTDPGSTLPPPPPPPPSSTPTYPSQHPRIYVPANAARLQAALSANRPAAVRWKQLTDQWLGGADLWSFRAYNAALAGQLTNQPQYCAKAVAVIDAQVSAAETAIAGHAKPEVANDSYLELGDLIGDLALVYDWCNPTITSSQKTRWLAYANQAVWNVWHPSQATWGGTAFPWSGWATDDPSDNYYYSFLRGTMLLGLAAHGESTQADQWLAQFHDTKVMGELVPTFNSDLVGGGSREGTGYGVAMRNLFKLYDIWRASTGEDLADRTPHTRASILAFMHQVVPTLDKVAPTGDLSRDSTAAFFDYHRDYLQTLVTLYAGDPIATRAKQMLDTVSVPRMANQFMAVDDFLYDATSVAPAAIDLNTTYYASGIGELYARSSWSDKHATWINLIAGPYTQSHAHQDQGSLMIYKDGWLGYDAVVSSHSGLTQATTAHSLVRIDSGGQPVRQVASTISRLVGLHKTAEFTYAAADLTPAYDGNAAIQNVQREVVFLPPNVVVVYDRVQSAAGTAQTWQFATPVRPSISGATATISGSGHTLSIQRLAPAASSSVHDMTAESDYAGGFRLDEAMAGGNQRYLHVLSIDGAATNVTASGDSSVSLTVGGRPATVTFNHDAPGASLTLGGQTTQLSASVDTLPN